MNKSVKITAIIFLVTTLFTACSDDNSNLTEDANATKGELSIKATSGLSGSRPKANVNVNEFMINIKEIEFEYAAGQNAQGLVLGKSGDDDGNSDGDDDNGNSDGDDDNGGSNDDNSNGNYDGGSSYLNFDELPIEIQNYITNNYPNDPFCQAEMEDNADDPYLYKVELQSGLALYFSADYTLYASEQNNEGCDGNNNNDNGNNNNNYGSDDEQTLAGPYELDLSQGSTTVTNVNIPEGVYEKVNFKMDVSGNPSSDLYQKSILLTGMIDGTPFEFYHTFKEDFEVDYQNAGQNLIIDANNNSITLNFNISAVLANVDLSGATDANNDGVINISPVDTDGNQQLANAIKNAIVQQTELNDD